MDNNDVLWLDVSVQKLPLMHVLHCFQKIFDNKGCGLLAVSFLLFQFCVQLSFRSQLQQNVNVLLVLETSIKVDNVGMV